MVMSSGSLLRLRKGIDRAPAVVTIPGGFWDVAAASDADRIVALTHRGELWSVNDKTTRITAVDASFSLDLATTSNVIAVRERLNGADLTSFRRVTDGTPLGTARMTGARLSPSGRFALDDSILVATESGSVRYRNVGPPPGRAVGWIGETAVYGEDGALRWVDPAQGALKSTPMPCKGEDAIDVARARVVRTCEDGRVITAIEDKPSVLLDAGANADGSPLRRGRVDESEWFHSEGARPSPDGTLTARMGKGHVTIERTGTSERVVLGVVPGEAYFEARAGGFDVLVRGTTTYEAKVRIGPSSPFPPPLPEQRLDVQMPSGSTCVRMERRRTTRGEVRFNTGKGLDGPAPVCFCSGDKCEEAVLPPGLEMLEATSAALIAIDPKASPPELVVLDHRMRIAGRVALTHICTSARADDAGAVVALSCKGASKDKGEILEVNVPSPAIVRRTPYALDAPHLDPTPLLATGRAGYVLLRAGLGSSSARMIERETGRDLADIVAWPTVAVVRFADGQLETFGDRRALDHAIFCVEEAHLAACPASVETKGRFRLD